MCKYNSFISLIKFLRTTFRIFLFLSFIYLPLFMTIYVKNGYPGQATISWDPPITNVDGTLLDDLGGYRIFYGTSSGNYSQNIDVGNVTEFTISNLTDGFTYYFVTTAYDTSGNESEYSNEVSKIISSITQEYTLRIKSNGAGTGVVTSSPAGINCGSDCSEIYNQGMIVTLRATPSANSFFSGWSSGACTGTGTCSISLNTDITITPIFSLKKYQCGDINNDSVIDVVDALMIARHTAKFQVSNFDSEAGDINCDGNIDIVDALGISRKIAKLTVSKWCCQ